MDHFIQIKDMLMGLDPLTWWLALLAIFGLSTGFFTGYFRARKIQPNGFKWPIFRREVGWAVFNVSVTTLVLGAVSSFLKAKGWISFNSEPASGWVIAMEYAIYFLGFDTWFYWWHRLMHMERFYNLTHKVHHGSITPNPVTSLSMNPVEGIIEGAWVPVLTSLLTLHETTMIFVIPTAVVMGQYVHSGFEILPSWWNRSWLTKWFISATFHDQHHRYFKGNYGGYTTIWDHICGTVRPRYEVDFVKITTRPIRRAPDAKREKATT
ncbi:sterol desaturase family protein [Sphingobium sufflavum]|uniref:sterol desaturase family protein n=1 Tax=Sphingobium sufflavum TaxID=1129547 RepID=UPI001F1EF640|nr:sterol desaturase family protein [Sphingobium sufflavum]MCE7798900.1 sterol desaturase family protein [Sphingobium sufflavum]